MSKIDLLEKYYLNFKQDLRRAGAYLNKQSLQALARKKNPQEKFWQDIEEDVVEIEKYLGEKLKPRSKEELEHQKVSTKILQNMANKKPIKDLVEKSALLRRSLG